MFFKLLALLVVSYVVFLVLAHVTRVRDGGDSVSGAVEPFTTPLGVAYPDADAAIVAADDAPLRVLKDLHVDRFVTYAHRTLMANADLKDGPVHRREPDAQESIPAFVRRCVEDARTDAACVAVAVYAPSETDVRCVCKRRRPRDHRRRHRSGSGSRDGSAPVVVDAHTAWTLRETEPQEAGLVFVKADVLRDGRVVPPDDDTGDHQAPVVVIKEVDSATSAKGFALDQPTTYDRDEPPASLLDKYGHFDSPPTVWSSPQPDAPKCLVNVCNDGTGGCPVQLSNTYATPATNSRVGSILPPFTYTECR